MGASGAAAGVDAAAADRRRPRRCGGGPPRTGAATHVGGIGLGLKAIWSIDQGLVPRRCSGAATTS